MFNKKLPVFFLVFSMAVNPISGLKLIKQNHPKPKSKQVASLKPKESPGSNQTGRPPEPVVTASPDNENGATKQVNNQAPAPVKQAQVSSEQVATLARIIHAEAGGEPLVGQVAVGAVLLNRVRSGVFPRSLAANIFKYGEFESVSNGYIWSDPTPAAYQAATLALKGWDPTYGALYFYNPAKARSAWIWNRPIITKIGGHVFAR
jgi:N-acetylmuramoyl-L-alanine amidase